MRHATIRRNDIGTEGFKRWTVYVGSRALYDIEATEINFPCGTEELASSVAALVGAAPDPAHTIVGLRNHGITATGESLTEILDRIEPSLLRQVPMS